MDGPIYTRLCEGFTPVAQPDNGGHVVGYGFDFVNGKPVQPGDTMTEDEAAAYFPTPYGLAAAQAAADLGGAWAHLDDVRQAALTDMAYEMGGAGLAGFPHMLIAVRTEDWPTAAAQCLASAGYGQSPCEGVRLRALRTSRMLATGNWQPGYGG